MLYRLGRTVRMESGGRALTSVTRTLNVTRVWLRQAYKDGCSGLTRLGMGVSRQGADPKHPDILTHLYRRCRRHNTTSVTASLPDSDRPLPPPFHGDESEVRKLPEAEQQEGGTAGRRRPLSRTASRLKQFVLSSAICP